MSNKDLVIFASIISAGLIKPADYIPCCDEIIVNEEDPSELIIDLSLMKDEDAGVKRLLSEAYGNFEEDYPLPDVGFLDVCASFMKFQSGRISWETFLRSAIDVAEHGRCQWSANDFCRFLDSYMASDSNDVLTTNQSQNMAGVLKEDIEEINFYQEMVKQRNLTSLLKVRS